MSFSFRINEIFDGNKNYISWTVNGHSNFSDHFSVVFSILKLTVYVGRPITRNKYWIKYTKSRDRNKSNTMILFLFSIFNMKKIIFNYQPSHFSHCSAVPDHFTCISFDIFKFALFCARVSIILRKIHFNFLKPDLAWKSKTPLTV